MNPLKQFGELIESEMTGYARQYYMLDDQRQQGKTYLIRAIGGRRPVAGIIGFPFIKLVLIGNQTDSDELYEKLNSLIDFIASNYEGSEDISFGVLSEPEGPFPIGGGRVAFEMTVDAQVGRS